MNYHDAEIHYGELIDILNMPAEHNQRLREFQDEIYDCLKSKLKSCETDFVIHLLRLWRPRVK